MAVAVFQRATGFEINDDAGRAKCITTVFDRRAKFGGRFFWINSGALGSSRRGIAVRPIGSGCCPAPFRASLRSLTGIAARKVDQFAVLAAAANATKTIKVGTGVLLSQQRDTIQTAKPVSSIDQVSQSRFLLGTGGGWNQDELEDARVADRPRAVRSDDMEQACGSSAGRAFPSSSLDRQHRCGWRELIQVFLLRLRAPVHRGGALSLCRLLRSS
jgi:luciferase-like monooxygenase